MADISKCSGENCQIRNTCYRYTVPGNTRWQSYIKGEYSVRTGCDDYWEDENAVSSNR